MSHVRRFDHVGITVADLDTATQFFVALGLEIEGRTFVEGEFIDTVIGIPGSRTEIVMLRPPDNGTGVEVSRFVRPGCVPGSGPLRPRPRGDLISLASPPADGLDRRQKLKRVRPPGSAPSTTVAERGSMR